MYYFIINPTSSSGKGLEIWRRIETILEAEDVPYEAFILKHPGEATLLAVKISLRYTPCTIVALGGDGTINEVINGIRDFGRVTFACIPSGSGNDFMRGMHLSFSPEEMLQKILHPRRFREINVGQAAAGGKSRYFVVSAGIGYDAAVCRDVQNSRLKKTLNRFQSGKLVYTLVALRDLFSMKRQPLRIIINGRRMISCSQVYFAAAMNLRYEGGGFMFCPSARPGDDLLDLCIADGIPRWKVLLLLPLAYFGKHVGKKGIHILQCRKAVFYSQTPLCVHTDGEIFGSYDKLTIQLLPKKLKVITG